jgi:type II secretory pathway pseudopilin PulG
MGRKEKQQGGFTIIEVILFLAISALLLSIALIGTRGSIQAGRYTDSVRSTESNIEKQFSDVVNGVNPRASNLVCDTNGNVSEVGSGGTPPGKTDCVLMGKLLHFTNGQPQFIVRPVVGVEPSSLVDTSEMTDFELIFNYSPHIVNVASTAENAPIPWQATVGGVKRSDGSAVNSVALLRSPRSGSILTYAFSWDGTSDITSAVATTGNYLQNKSVNVCIESADNGTLAAITIGGGQGQAAIATDFDGITQNDCQGS